MTKRSHPTLHQPNSENSDFFIWLGRNMVPIAVLLVLLVGGIIVFLIKNTSTTKETPKTATAKSIDKSSQDARYLGADCDKNAYCRQLKRISAEGGRSLEAIRQNLLVADKNVTFQQLQEDAAKYEGAAWAFEGKIVDIIGQEKRGIGDYILADIIIGDDPAKQLSVKGDFATDFAENDSVYVVGYITGTSNPRFGPNRQNYGSVPGLSARALLKPSEARDLLERTVTN